MVHYIPSPIQGEVTKLMEKPEDVVEIPYPLVEIFKDIDWFLHDISPTQMKRLDKSGYIEYALPECKQTLCFMHFKDHSIKIVYPVEFLPVLRKNKTPLTGDTQHGAGTPYEVIKDNLGDFKTNVLRILLEIQNLNLLRLDKEREGTEHHFAPLSVTGTSLEDVVGLEEVKQEIARRILLPYRHPDIFAKYGLSAGGGIMLYGPPGNGKTLIARAVASELGIPFFAISPSDIMKQFLGETEDTIKNLFDDLGKYPESILFVDEADSIFPVRGNPNAPWESSMTNEFLIAMDGIKKKESKILFIGATNNLDLIDPAILRPGRFDAHILVSEPGPEGRNEILHRNLENIPHEDTIDYDKLIGWTDQWSAAEITELCNTAKAVRAIRESKKIDEFDKLRMEDIIHALKLIMGQMVNEGIQHKEDRENQNTRNDGGHSRDAYVADPDLTLPGYA